MPVEDINAEKLAIGFLNVFESAETTTEFWKINADLLSFVLIGIILLGIILAMIVFARYGVKKALT